MAEVYGKARLGRQELLGEFLEDAEDALWTRDLIERCRVECAPQMRRIVIGVDPPASAGGDACGIIAVGKGADGKAYVLADHSVKGRSPEGWARAVAAAADAWCADRVVAEANQGGDMVVSTLQAADVAMPVKKVHAARGKVARAEPVAALYEAGKAYHAGSFPELEDELCGLIAGGGYEGPGRSPDRADALVWAMTELMLGMRGVEPRVRQL
jgi:phage terminase large subunit-like protein